MQLRSTLETLQILDEYQGGFKSGKSIVNNFYYLTQEIKLSYMQKQSTICIFLDTEKEFNKLSPFTIIIKYWF